MNSKVLGVITARGGSKGIPGKNIKPFLGKPLIAYTIETAQKSGVLDRIILSTDDSVIAEVAKRYGCEVPFMRPTGLAGDKAHHLPVMQHAVTWLKNNEGYYPDYVMILQPTSPLRQPFHIQEALTLILKTNADAVLSVSKIPENFSPYKAMLKDEQGFLRLFNGDPIKKRTAQRQDLRQAYWSDGSIYLFKTNLLFDTQEPSFYGDRVVSYLIENKYVADINVPEDWESAEVSFKKLFG